MPAQSGATSLSSSLVSLDCWQKLRLYRREVPRWISAALGIFRELSLPSGWFIKGTWRVVTTNTIPWYSTIVLLWGIEQNYVNKVNAPTIYIYIYYVFLSLYLYLYLYLYIFIYIYIMLYLYHIYISHSMQTKIIYYMYLMYTTIYIIDIYTIYIYTMCMMSFMYIMCMHMCIYSIRVMYIYVYMFI